MSGWSLKSFGERMASGLEKGLQDLEQSIQQQAHSRQSQSGFLVTGKASPRVPTQNLPPRLSEATPELVHPQSSPSQSENSKPDLADSALANRSNNTGGVLSGSSKVSPLAEEAGQGSSRISTEDKLSSHEAPPPRIGLPEADSSLAASTSPIGRGCSRGDIQQRACRIPLPESPVLAPTSGSDFDRAPLVEYCAHHSLADASSRISPSEPHPHMSTDTPPVILASAEQSPQVLLSVLYDQLVKQEANLGEVARRIRSAGALHESSVMALVEQLQSKAHVMISEVKAVRDRPAVNEYETSNCVKPVTFDATEAATSRNHRATAQELAKAREQLKAEEEKRAKSVALLKAVRQKLALEEKEKAVLIEEAKLGADAAQRERARSEADLTNLRASQEQQIHKLRSSFDRETNSIRAQYEREAVARKGQHELDALTARAAHQKEIAGREAQLQTAESERAAAIAERDRLFAQLQVRQADTERLARRNDDAREHANELEHELSEARDRIASLVAEVERSRSTESDSSAKRQSNQAWDEEVLRLRESTIEDLRLRLAQSEKERLEVEQTLGHSLEDRLGEVERVRKLLAEKEAECAGNTRDMREKELGMREEQSKHEALLLKVEVLERRAAKTDDSNARLLEEIEILREKWRSQTAHVTDLETRLKDAANKEAFHRTTTKGLRDEIRKLQSGVILSEKQRNPGVGYFASLSGSAELPLMAASTDAVTPSPPLPNGAVGRSVRASQPSEAEVNYEYLRNTVLQFLEHKEMRPHLVRVLAVILRFTPEETRRLTSKVST